MKILIAALVVVGLPVLLPGALAAQSPLAEAAAKAAAARTEPRPPVKTVFTTKDLPQGKPAPTVPAAPAVAPPALTGAREPGTASMMKTEPYWQDRMRRLQATLDGDLIAARAITIRLADYQAALKRSERPSPRGVLVDRDLSRKVDDTTDELSRATAAVQTDELAIATLAEEARVAGVPPGWLRPGPR